MNRVAVIGLGLIGGSIAKALRERLDGVYLLAVDRPEVGECAEVRAIVSEFIALDEVAAHRQNINACDLVILCQPVRIITDTISSYLSAGTVVTDTGSTKRAVVRSAGTGPESHWFVPGHPMAGKAQGGFENAVSSLFVGRPWILCPDDRNEVAVARVAELIDVLGAERVDMTAEKHDAAVALTSHVPQLLSSWLRLAGSERNVLSAAGPAFSDMTRTAGGAEAIWRDIFETNADEVGHLLRDASFALSAVADALLAEPPRIEAVLEVLRKARASR